MQGTLRSRLIRHAVSTAVCSATLVAVVAADETRDVAFTQQPGRVAITIGGELMATYVYDDPEITRPYFAHVHAPGGIQVTRNHPPIAGQDTIDHPTFHPGIWLAFGDISGNDYWRLKARVVHDSFVDKPRGDPGQGSFAVRNRYLAAGDESRTVCGELCRFTVAVRPAGYLLIWDSTFTADHEFYFGDQEEMGLGIRMATPLRVEQGGGSIPPGNGTIVDAEGRRNGAEVGGNAADWCDYSGTLAGRRVGITIFCHPDNFRPSWFHARDYGFVAANPFGRAAFRKGPPSKVVVKRGESLRLRYGILLHADPQEEQLDLDAAYADYQQLAGGHE
jgi:hypothetical protein